jgi:signal transduction histidine kinase
LDQTEDRLHPDDRDRVVAARENFIADRQPDYDLQFRLRHKDGTYRWIHSRGALVRDANGRPIRMLGLNLDITEFKQAKELEQRRTEMEREFRSHVATQTAAAIAHELNQPLTAVAYYAYVAQELLETNNWIPYTLSGILEKCSQQAQRAGDVIRLLMEILQKDDVASEPVDIITSVHYALAFVKAQTDLDAISIRLELEEGLPPVSANPMQIQKIVASLLQNGLESMRESGENTGTITVRACRFPENPDMVQVTVSDSGKGVADAAGLETLFQPLFPTKAKGVGLSLAVSQALIQAHGGKMWAEQNVGPGLSISFTLPIGPLPSQ